LNPFEHSNPFEPSDNKDIESDGALLTHLVKDVSDVGFDSMGLDTKICDLMATGRKLKSNSRKQKDHKREAKNKKRCFHMKAFYWNSRGLADFG
jgi:hypothetical protein